MTDKRIYKIFNKMNKRDIYLLSNDNENIYKNVAKRFLELKTLKGGGKSDNTLSFNVSVSTEDLNGQHVDVSDDILMEWYQDRTFFEIDEEEHDILSDMYGLKLTRLRIKYLHDNVYNFTIELNMSLKDAGISPEDMDNTIETIKGLLADPDDDGNYPINGEVLVKGELV